jgi:uncharacterized membrane protein YgaE (UPF0421/DUF939 family)
MRLSHSTLRARPRRALQVAAHRLRPRLLAILQTAAAAVLAWQLAAALLPDPRPAFASIAAVIAVGATFGQRRTRAFELIGGVTLGLSVADVIVRAIGDGPLQMGVMVVLAMSTAVVLGGGALLVVEAAVSALLLAAIDPASTAGAALSPIRFAEALIGGGVALAVTSLFFPPNPVLIVGRAMQAVFAELGRALEQVADALAQGDSAGAQRALAAARGIDERLHALDDAFGAARETARLAPPHRRSREHIDRYGRTLAQIDFAVRNTRVLARNALNLVRAGRPAPDLAEAVRELSFAVWELAAAYDEPHRSGGVGDVGRRAAARAAAVVSRGGDPAVIEVAGQVRSTAVDLVRAAELIAGAAPPEERPTEELLRPCAELRLEPLPAI